MTHLSHFQVWSLGLILLMGIYSCDQGPSANQQDAESSKASAALTDFTADHTLDINQTHNKFSSAIPPVLRVQSGAIIDVQTQEASAGQIHCGDDVSALDGLEFDPIHPLTGPVYVEGAEPGDVLKVKLLQVELVDCGWNSILPGFGFLADKFTEPYLKTYPMQRGDTHIQFSDKIRIPLKPFPGVMGVAPETPEMLSTIPPRENGGNMDDPHMVEGTTVYFPVFVPGALFSIGDGHAVQGMGEVCGTAVEAPLHIVYKVELIKGGRALREPEYETDDYYAVTSIGKTIDEAAKKAVAYMVDYLEAEQGLSRNEAYALCSLAGDLQIAEVVDVPNMMVAMHMSKEVLGIE